VERDVEHSFERRLRGWRPDRVERTRKTGWRLRS
jgi:hypothetical protein